MSDNGRRERSVFFSFFEKMEQRKVKFARALCFDILANKIRTSRVLSRMRKERSRVLTCGGT